VGTPSIETQTPGRSHSSIALHGSSQVINPSIAVVVIDDVLPDGQVEDVFLLVTGSATNY